MDFGELLRVVGNEPLFETGILLAGNVNPDDVRRQLSRWVNAGKVVQLRRGLYTLAAPLRKVTPHPFVISNRLSRPSYVSLQSALAYHGHIPEWVPVTTGLTTRRPERLRTQLGEYQFRHLKRDLFFGFDAIEVAPGQRALVAKPEKALLDLLHLTPCADRQEYLNELRLQVLEDLVTDRLDDYAARWKSPKIDRATSVIHAFIRTQKENVVS